MPRRPGEQYAKQKRRKSNTIYNQSRSKGDKQYYTTQWKLISKLYRKQHPLCEECEREGMLTPADLVDHIVAVTDGGSMWSWDNLQSLCMHCHNKKHFMGVNDEK